MNIIKTIYGTGTLAFGSGSRRRFRIRTLCDQPGTKPSSGLKTKGSAVGSSATCQTLSCCLGCTALDFATIICGSLTTTSLQWHRLTLMSCSLT